jgi:hypothetical protein
MKFALCAILLLASPAFATIAQQRNNFKWNCSGTVSGTSGTGTLTCPQNFTTTGSDDLIAVWTTWQSSVTLTATVADSFGSYAGAVGPTQQPTQATGVPANAQLFYLKSTGTGGIMDTVTVTLTGPAGTAVPSFGMVMVEYSGLDTVAPLDSVSEAISNATAPSNAGGHCALGRFIHATRGRNRLPAHRLSSGPSQRNSCNMPRPTRSPEL